MFAFVIMVTGALAVAGGLALLRRRQDTIDAYHPREYRDPPAAADYGIGGRGV
ncbi:MAG: hypothetical protein S0880_12380 [Actinomycetota bacterium]|nr:hypothetical protein [Actinomycetota bacterium]